MTEYNIDLSLLKSNGQTLTEVRDGILRMTVTRANPLNHCKPRIRCVHYAEAPDRYHLPLRIDVTAKIDVPALFIALGEGHVKFGEPFDHRRISGICEPQDKIIRFDSLLPMNEFNDITLIYDLKEMQILINGEERYYSKNERYMKSPLFKRMNEEGFPLKISCGKRTNLEIRSICITEYEQTTGIVHTHDIQEDKPMPTTEKPTFESCIAKLPAALHTAVVDVDTWVRALRPIKFKRQIDKNGNKITYVASEQGFSYAIHFSETALYHTLQWYILTQGKPETWGRRKADRMEDTLNHLAQTDPAFAKRLFNNLFDCVGGYGSGCMAKTPYTFDGEKIIACHGKMHFNMKISEFDDVKRFIGAVNELQTQETSK